MAGEWPERSIGEVCWVYDGPHATPKKIDSGPYFLGISSLNSGRLSLSASAHVSEDDFKKWTRRVTPQENDIVFSYETRIGEVGLIPAGLRCCLGRRMGLMRPRDDSVDPRFLLYLYLSPQFQDFLRSRTVHGSTVDRILLTEFPSFPIPLPPLPEQKAIAHILGSLDDKIELNRKMNETLEAMARAIFKSWFVDYDPVRAKSEGRKPEGMDEATAKLFPDSFVDSELGKIPKGWRVGTVSEIAHVVDCLHSKKPPAAEEGKLLLQVYNVGENGRLDLSKPFVVSEADYVEWTKRIEVQEQDLVITKTGRVGAVARIRQGFRSGVGRNMVAVRAKVEETTPMFLADCFLSDSMRREITSNTTDGTILKSLHVKAIERLMVVVPPLGLSHHYASLVAPLHEKLDRNDESGEILSKTRDALLPKLLSGKLRIKDAEKFVEDVA